MKLNLKENTILIGMLNPSKNKNQINKIIKKKLSLFLRIITSNYKSSINGRFIFSIKFSWI